MAAFASSVLPLLRDDSAWTPSLAAQSLRTVLSMLGPLAPTTEEEPEPTLRSLKKEFEDLELRHELFGMQKEKKCWTFEQHENPILGNGLVATEDIKPMQRVLSVPIFNMLNTQFPPSRDPRISLALSKFEDNPSLELAVCLLFHRYLGDGSLFQSYIQVLPTQFGIPTCWSPETLEAASFLPCFSKCVQSIRACLALFIRFRQTISGMKEFPMPLEFCTWTNFRWAMAVVSTRQNEIPLGEESCMALVPVWDMMNHEPGPQTTGYDPDSLSLVFHAMRAVPKGSSLTMCYGHRSNEMLLLYSGFASEDNEFDSMDLKISIQRDALAKIRDLLLQNMGITVSKDGLAEVKVSREVSSDCLIKCLYSFLVNRATKEMSLAIMKAKDNIKSCSDPNSLLKLINELENGLASAIVSDLTHLVASNKETLEAEAARQLPVLCGSTRRLEAAVGGEIQKLVQGYFIIFDRLGAAVSDLSTTFSA